MDAFRTYSSELCVSKRITLNILKKVNVNIYVFSFFLI
jgi:hypothetical protein